MGHLIETLQLPQQGWPLASEKDGPVLCSFSKPKPECRSENSVGPAVMALSWSESWEVHVWKTLLCVPGFTQKSPVGGHELSHLCLLSREEPTL